MLTQERIRNIFEYSDGNLIWKVKISKKVNIGDIAGCSDPRAYVRISIDKKPYKAHRLIWLYHYGYLPENKIDHIDRKRLNNKIENLREVTQTCNMRNTGNPTTNTSGVKGVMWCRHRKNWRCFIKVNSIAHSIGRFDSFTEAVAHRLAVEQCLKWEGCDSSSPAFKYIKNMSGVK